MIGRAATKNPWIFRQAAALATGRQPEEASLLARRDLVLEHFRRVAEREESRWALHKLRKFTGWYTHGVPHGRELRQKINELADVAAFLEAVESFFSDLERKAA
jgi:tRNA-dihydrouridine synthase